MTITLTKPETAVVWRSATGGSKTTVIPGSNSSNNGYELVVKTTKNNGDSHAILPTSGTIGGQSSFFMLDNGGSAHFLSDGANFDWVTVCVCTNPIVPSYNLLRASRIEMDNESTVAAPGVIASSVTPHNIDGVPIGYPIRVDSSNPFDTIGNTETRLVAFIYSECLPPPTGLTPAPTVTSVDDDHGLVWQRRSAFTAYLPATRPDTVGRSQNINFETWMADCTSLVDGDIVQVTAHFSSSSFVPNINVMGFYNAGDWDDHPSLPASIISTTSNNLPRINMGTNGSQSLIIIYYVTPEGPDFALEPVGIPIELNPVFIELFNTQTAFWNLNEDPTPPIDQISDNSAALYSQSVSSGRGQPTRLSFPTDINRARTWNFYGFGGEVDGRTTVITDTARTNLFISNSFIGFTGMTEPVWNTTEGAVTVDGTVTWVCLGTSFFVAPIYTTVPSWTEPWIGGGHFVGDASGPIRCTDSTRTYIFAIDPFLGIDPITGLTEPIWDTSVSGAQTVDGTGRWKYVGLYADSIYQELLVVVDAIDII